MATVHEVVDELQSILALKNRTFLKTQMLEWYKFSFTTVSLVGMISIEHVINSSIGSEDLYS